MAKRKTPKYSVAGLRTIQSRLREHAAKLTAKLREDVKGDPEEAGFAWRDTAWEIGSCLLGAKNLEMTIELAELRGGEPAEVHTSFEYINKLTPDELFAGVAVES